MKPRNKYQQMVLEYSRHLPPLSDYQYRQAVDTVAPHTAKLNAKGQYVCMDCGHTWYGDRAERTVCPGCGRKFEVQTDRKKSYSESYYIQVVTVFRGFQVFRMFMFRATFRKGSAAEYTVREAFQRWTKPGSKDVIVGRSRCYPGFYCDLWNFSSKMEIRSENVGHGIGPYAVVGIPRVLPEYVRNGFRGDFHRCSPYDVLNRLVTDNRFETMWKVGRYDLASHYLFHDHGIDRVWPSLKVAMRHHYIQSDIGLWEDVVRILDELGKDIRNPALICPPDLCKAHAQWLKKLQTQRQREKTRRDIIEAAEYEAQYSKEKKNFLDLEFSDREITVRPLLNVMEFVTEGELMHHCVFANKYYQKASSLILHALVEEVSVATIEFDLRELRIVQCRAKFNQKPELDERIRRLIDSNKDEIAGRKYGRRNRRNHRKAA